MEKRNSTSFLACFMAALMLLSLLSGLAVALKNDSTVGGYKVIRMSDVTAKSKKANSGTMEEVEQIEQDPNEIVTIIVQLSGDPVLKTKGVLNADTVGSKALSSKGETLQDTLLAKQNAVINTISNELMSGEKIDVAYNYTLTFNGFAFDGPFWLIDEINKLDGVANAEVSMVFQEPVTYAGDDDNAYTKMYSADDMVYAYDAWDLGYRGEGMLVAILDTGMYTAHEAFQTAPENPKYQLSDIEEIFAKNDMQCEKRSNGDLTAEMCYLRAKVPFVYDYAGNDTDVNHYGKVSDHGTHVAGITAAYGTEPMNGLEGVYVRGVACQAQIAVLKVFGDTGGGASWTNIIAALEDCIYLGADVANLSLGTGVGYPNQSSTYQDVYELLNDNGCALSCAASNDYSSAYNSSWGTNMLTTEHADGSTVGSPSTYDDSLSVAAINNNKNYYANYIEMSDSIMTFTDTGVGDLKFCKAFGGQELDVVVVPNLGKEEDYENIDVTGKIALIQRGDITFNDKQIIAYNHGALGVIVYDNIFENSMINMQITEYVIPSIFVNRTNGLFIIDKVATGAKLKVSNIGTIADSATASTPSGFSSWGPLVNLTIKPEIAAPGGNIMSTVDPKISGQDNDGAMYASMSGTSMAAPNMTGCIALVRQYVEKSFPNLTDLEKVNLVNALLMCTANPVVSSDGTPYAVRKQGSGMADVLGAISTRAMIKVDGEDWPKLEIGDDPERTGVYTLKFNVYNFGNETLSYTINPVLTTADYEWVDQGDRATWVQKESNKNLTDMMKFTSNMPDNKVTVEAGKTVAVEVTMTVDDNFRKLMAEIFPNGGYVEGYCTLNGNADAEGAMPTDLSVCYLGYYGSWCEVPVVDTGYYYDDPADDHSMMAYPNTAGSKYRTGVFYELGMNPYFDETDEADAEALKAFSYISDRNAISPANKDKYFDEVDQVYTGVMRSLQQFYYRITDAKTGELLWERVTNGAVTKNWDSQIVGYINPMGISANKIKSWDGEGYQVEGDTAIIRVGGQAYYQDKEGNSFWNDAETKGNDYWEFPVTIDNTTPTVVKSWAEGSTVYVTFTDNMYAAYAGLYTLDNLEEPIKTFCVAENARNAQTTISFDMGSNESLYLLLGDYACNEAQYQILKNGSVYSPLPTPPETDETYYTPINELTYGDTYIITTKGEFVDRKDDVIALTGTVAQPYDIRLQGTTVDVTDAFIMGGEKYSGMEWIFNADGSIQNVLSGQYLGLVNYSGSYWLGTTATADVHWVFDGNSLSHTSSLTTDKALIFYPTIENSDSAAFDIFDPAQSFSKISLYKKVAQTRNVEATVTTNIREDGNNIIADVSISKNAVAASGMFTVSYDSTLLQYKKCKSGVVIENCMLQLNDAVPGKLVVGFAGSELIDQDGGLVFTVTFEKTAKASAGTLVVIDLVCNELISDDTTTRLKVDVAGSSYVVGGGSPNPTTPAPTTPAPTTPAPTTPAPTTPAPACDAVAKLEYVSEENGILTVGVTISEKTNAASGIFTVTYDSNLFTYKKYKGADVLDGYMLMPNYSTAGQFVLGFAGSEPINDEGGMMFTLQLTINDGVANGTKTELGLICNEFVHIDTTTMLTVETHGLTYTVGGGAVTPDPTTPAPTTPAPTTPAPTTPAPTTPAPTTPAPTTPAPTTPAPTTPAPTTPAPTTPAPTTPAPTTPAPTTPAPTTPAPTTPVPTTAAPATPAPTTAAPTTPIATTAVPTTPSNTDPENPGTGASNGASPFIAIALGILGISGVAYFFVKRKEEDIA